MDNHDKSATYFFMIAFSFIFLSFLSSQAIPFSFWCIVFTLPYPNGEKWIDYSVYNLRIPFFFCTFWSLGIPGYPGVTGLRGLSGLTHICPTSAISTFAMKHNESSLASS